MMHYKRFLVVLLSITAVLLLLPARPAHAAPLQEDEVIFGDSLTLVEGERIDGDLVIIGGELTMRVDSRVDGSVTVVGGPADVNGRIDGDLVVVGATIDLGENARVDGDVVSIGGRVEKAPGAQTGDVVQGLDLENIRAWRDIRLPFTSPDVGFRPRSVIWSTITTLGGSFLLALLGMVIVALWPSQTNEVGRTIVSAPVPSTGLGCLIYPLALSLALFILITICLAPFVPVVVLLLIVAILFGWIALGSLFGRWLARALGWHTASPVAATGLGVFALSILGAIVGAIPCLGSLLVLFISSAGLGAVVLSRFGTQHYGARPEAPVPPAPVDAMPLPADAIPPSRDEDALDVAIREAITSSPDIEVAGGSADDAASSEEGAGEEDVSPEAEAPGDEKAPPSREEPPQEDKPASEAPPATDA
jgi:hypothetical protein